MRSCLNLPQWTRYVCAFLLAMLGGNKAVIAENHAEPRWLVEAPTAGVLPSRQAAVDIRFFGGNSLLADFEVGLWRRVLVGVSFGGQNLLGNEAADWNPDPGVSARVRVLNETATRPAFAIGFRSQGTGFYDDALNRYQSKSLGVYGVFSRNYRNPTGQGGVHFGLNRSLEADDGDESLTGFVGLDLEVAGKAAVIAEYLFGFNDDDSQGLGKGRGNLNVGIRWLVTPRVSLEFDLKDVFENNGRLSRSNREVRLVFLRGDG
jgi:hypothetical protein